jgi:hypothetical protein
MSSVNINITQQTGNSIGTTVATTVQPEPIDAQAVEVNVDMDVDHVNQGVMDT